MKALHAFAFISMLAACPASAQDAAPAQDAKVRVTLADATAPPEWEVRVPVSLTIVEGTGVSRVTARVSYPAKVLSFMQADPTATLKTSGGQVKATPQTAAGSDTAVVDVEMRAAEKGNASLPGGVAAILVFKVAEAADPATWPITVGEVRAWADPKSASALTAAGGEKATLTIAPAGLPIFACFFYMH